MSEFSSSEVLAALEMSKAAKLNERFRSRSFQQDFLPLKILWLLKRESRLMALVTTESKEAFLEQLYFEVLTLSKEKYPVLINILRKHQVFFEHESLHEMIEYIKGLNELEFLPFQTGYEPFPVPKGGGNPLENLLFPKSLVRLLAMMMAEEESTLVCNPWSHIGQLYRYVPEGLEFRGQIPLESDWMNAQMRLIEYQIQGRVKITNEDPNQHWFKPMGDSAVIITMPPLGGQASSGSGRYDKLERTIRKASESVNAGGKAIVFVPSQFLNSSKNSIVLLREHLVEGDLVDSIVYMPSRFWGWKQMQVDWAMLLLKKDKTNQGEITLINGSKYEYIDDEDPGYSDRFGPELDEHVLLGEWSKVQSRQSNFSPSRLKGLETRIRLVGQPEIRDNQYELSPPKYLLPHIDGVRLGEIASIAKVTSSRKPVKKRFVRIRDLKNSLFDYLLDPSGIRQEVSKSSKAINCKKLTTSALLVSSRWNALKPTYYVYENEPLYLSPDVYALELDTNTIDPQYLVYQLMQQQAIEQLQAYQIGVVVPTIRKQDLLNIRIPVPPLEEQRKILIQALGESESRLGQLFEKNLEQEKERWREELAAVEHNLRNGLSPLISGFSAIKKFLKSSEGKQVSLDSLISTRSSTTLGEFIDNQIRNVKDLNSRLGSLEQQLVPKSEELLNIDKIIQERIMSYEGKELYRIEYDYVRSSFLSEDSKEIHPLIKMGRSEFLELFDNVISNAEKHGFGQGFRAEGGNKIKIAVLYDAENQNVKLAIANNGKPLPDGMNHERVIKRLETGSQYGKGIGGAEIQRIVQRYGGTFHISGYPVDKYPSFPFTVNYQFFFPLIIDSI